eukprot:38228_1
MHLHVLLYSLIASFALLMFAFLFIFPDNVGAHPATKTFQHKEDKVVDFWGERTSVYDWCESNYQHFPFIAETWNSLTGFAYVILGLFNYFYYRHKCKDIDLYILHPWGGIMQTSVGIGTVLFHATLKYEFELYDELSIMNSLFLAVVLLLQRNATKTNFRFGLWSIPGLIFVWAALVTLIGSATANDHQSLMHQMARLGGGITAAASIAWSMKYYINLIHECIEKDKKNNFVRSYFVRCTLFFIVAITFWIGENMFCQYTQMLELHAFVWHLLTALAIHYMFQMLTVHRLAIHPDVDLQNVDIIPGLLSFVSVKHKQ